MRKGMRYKTLERLTFAIHHLTPSYVFAILPFCYLANLLLPFNHVPTSVWCSEQTDERATYRALEMSDKSYMASSRECAKSIELKNERRNERKNERMGERMGERKSERMGERKSKLLVT